jgi:hypothetical protein
MSKRLALLIVGLVVSIMIFANGCTVKVYEVKLPAMYPMMQTPYQEMIDEAEKDNQETPWEKSTPGGPKYYI